MSNSVFPIRIGLVSALSVALFPLFAASAVAADDSVENKPTSSQLILGDQASQDPFLGDWEGKWSKGWPPNIVAQVIPRGSDTYQINFLEAFDARCPAFADFEGEVVGDALKFDAYGWSGEFSGDELRGVGLNRDKPVEFSMKKVTRLSPRLGAKPPKNAIVLFDGGDFGAWEVDPRRGATSIDWKLIDDHARTWPPLSEHAFGASIRTKDAWPSFRLYVEFRLPLIPAATGQTRGNSGVIIEEFEFYEVQILDSYGLSGYWNECGAIYKKEAPKVNMCAPPGQWQSYDIVYRGPRFDDEGKLAANPRITVDHNGKRIHNDVELPYSENALRARREKPETKTPGRITLQHHGDPVDFRNIWLQPLKSGAK